MDGNNSMKKGEPSETGLLLDAQAALDFVTGHERLKGGKVILYGQSIGGAVAIAMAAKNQGKVDALIIENTFTSLKETIQSVFGPYLGFIKYFCHQAYIIQNIFNIVEMELVGRNQDDRLYSNLVSERIQRRTVPIF